MVSAYRSKKNLLPDLKRALESIKMSNDARGRALAMPYVVGCFKVAMTEPNELKALLSETCANDLSPQAWEGIIAALTEMIKVAGPQNDIFQRVVVDTMLQHKNLSRDTKFYWIYSLTGIGSELHYRTLKYLIDHVLDQRDDEEMCVEVCHLLSKTNLAASLLQRALRKLASHDREPSILVRIELAHFLARKYPNLSSTLQKRALSMLHMMVKQDASPIVVGWTMHAAKANRDHLGRERALEILRLGRNSRYWHVKELVDEFEKQILSVDAGQRTVVTTAGVSCETGARTA